MGKQSSPNNSNSSNPQCPKITQPITKPKSPPKVPQTYTDHYLIDQNLMIESSIYQNHNNLQNQSNSSYDFKKGLSFEEKKSLQKHFQLNSSQDRLQHFMVSIKALMSVSDMVLEGDFLQNKPSLDLICVIDNSGLMSGERIKNVQFTLFQLLDMLNDKDRLSLVLFNSSATLLCDLIRVDQANKTKIQNLIRNIQTGGCSDIESGIDIAFQMIKNRKQKNQASSVFHLSYGQGNGADHRAKLKKYENRLILLNDPITIHSFGYGERNVEIISGKVPYGPRQIQCGQGLVMQQKSQPNQHLNQSAPQQQLHQNLMQQKYNYQGGPQHQQLNFQLQNPINSNLSQLQLQQVINKSNIYQQSTHHQQQSQDQLQAGYPQSQQPYKPQPNSYLLLSMKPQNLLSGQTIMTQSQQIPQLGVEQGTIIKNPQQNNQLQLPSQSYNVPQQLYSQKPQQQQQKPLYQQSSKQLTSSQIQHPQQ